MSQAQAIPSLRRRSSASILGWIDWLTHATALSGALLMMGMLLLLLVVVFMGAYPAIQKFGWGFLWNSKWSSVKQNFGAAPLIYGTLMTAAIALLISLPISLGSALFLTKLAPKIRVGFTRRDGTRVWISPRWFVTITSFLIELLAAIPSIAYGLWGVFVLVPFMQKWVQPFVADSAEIGRFHLGLHMNAWPLIGPYFENTGVGYNIFTAGLILSIMITPIMTAITRDVLLVAPPELEQGALGLGATWWQATRLVLGYSKMGIFGAVILGFARAIGETMAVTMVIGNSSNTDKTLFSQGYTISSLLANQFRNADTEGEVSALVYAALVLLIITTIINGVARVMVMRLSARARRR